MDSGHERMSTKTYLIKTTLLMLIGLPLILQVVAFFSLGVLGVFNSLGVYDGSFHGEIMLFFGVLAGSAIAFSYGKKTDLPEKFIPRYLFFLAPVSYLSLAWIIALMSGVFTGSGQFGLFIGLFWPFVAYFGVFLWSTFVNYWLLPVSILASHVFFTLAFVFGNWRGKRLSTCDNRYATLTLSLVSALVAVSCVFSYIQYRAVFHGRDPKVEISETHRWDFKDRHKPFTEDNELIRPKRTLSLILEGGYPRLDGAIALLPVYGAAAQAIYAPENNADSKARGNAVVCNNTPSAYERLISGEADMIFVAAPSEQQKELAARSGVELTLTPIAKEAFVFLVNEQNPVKNLSVEDIRAIYRGEINNWREIGGVDEKILAFQRNQNSGSQTAMEQLVMRDTPMRKPLEVEYHGSMGGILRNIADYRNFANALGYSFRYYATAMNTVPGVALLSVNGIAPTPENIRSGVYPFVSDAYIVTARPLSENATKLRDWFLSDEGQELIADVGYVPIREKTER